MCHLNVLRTSAEWEMRSSNLPGCAGLSSIGQYERYGVLRNGILLYGPRGTGKTFLAKATAGDFGRLFEDVPAPELLTAGLAQPLRISRACSYGRRPVSQFYFSSTRLIRLGAGRQDAISDPGLAGCEFNNITMSLMMAPLTSTVPLTALC